MPSTVGEMIIKVGLVMDSFTKGMATVENRLDKFQRELKKTGRDLTEAITVPLAGIAFVAMRNSELATTIFSRFKDRISVIMGSLGDQIATALDLNGIVNSLSSSLAKAVGWFQSLSESTKKTIISILAFTAALGPLLLILSKLIGVIGSFLTLHGLIITAVLAAGYGVYKLADYLGMFDSKMVSATDSTEAQVIAMEKLNRVNSTFRIPGTPFSPVPVPYGHEYRGMGEPIPPRPAPKYDEVPTPEPWKGVKKPSAPAPAPIISLPGYVAAAKQLRDASVDIESSWKIMGGGTNVVKSNIDALTATYKKLESQVVTTTEANERLAAEGLKPSDATMAALQQASDKMVEIKQRIEDLQSPWNQFIGLMQAVPPMAQQIASVLMNVVQTFSQGVGDAIAQVLVYGASLRDLLKALMKQIVATVISSLVQIVVQRVIAMIAGVTASTTELIANMKAYAATTYAATYASISAIPIVGPAAAPAAATGAVTAMLAGSTASGAMGAGTGAAIAASATGGLFTHPGITRIAERGRPEIVLNQDNVRKFMGDSSRGGSQSISIYLDSDVITEKVVRGMPEYLRLQGAI